MRPLRALADPRLGWLAYLVALVVGLLVGAAILVPILGSLN